MAGAALAIQRAERGRAADGLPALQSIKEFSERVRADLTEYLRITRKSQATVAKGIGMSDTVISQFLGKSYRGDLAHVAHGINAWLILESGRMGIPREPMWVETRIAVEIHGALHLAHRWGDLGMVYGAAGLGKTRTGREYRRLNGDTVVMVTANHTTRSPYAFLSELADALNVPGTYALQKIFKEIGKKLRGSGRLLVVDEAQKLTYASVETLRALYDETGIGLVFMGDEVLWRTVTAGRTRAEHERLLSRIGIKRVILPGLDRADVAKIAVQYIGHTDPECIDFLTAKAGGVGGIRAIVKHSERAYQIAQLEGRTHVTVQDLHGASAMLGDDVAVYGGNGR